MELKHIVVPFVEVKASDANDDIGKFSGYGSVFGNVDLGGDIIEKGAFLGSLNRWKGRGEMPAMLGYHKFDNSVGDWYDMIEDDYGLKVDGRFWVYGNKRIEEAQKCYNVVTGTGPKGLSIGFTIIDAEDQVTERGTIRIIKEVELYEVSVVGFAMNPKAKVTAVKSIVGEDGQIASKREVEQGLRDVFKLSQSQAKAFIAGGYDSLNRDDSDEIKELLATLDQFSTTNKKGINQ